ncbi:MAG: acyl-CoA thioesterase [Ignavibacteria bacterium]|nr:acyl-CoA thioesterase [Ignavibacteria bacterium]
MISLETQIRVLYAHTDTMGVVSNVRYLEYFEAGRNELLRKIGFPYPEMEKENIALPVIEANIKYISTAKYDDIITIKSEIKDKPTVKIKIFYELSVDKKIITTGFTIHSFINLSTFKPSRPPQRLLNLINDKN